MKIKRFLAGLLTVAMVGASMAVPGASVQVEAATKKLTKITMPKNAQVYVGNKKQLKVTKAPKAVSAKITWSSSDRKIAKVSNKGVVQGVKAGKAVITATAVSGKITKKAQCTVTVKKKVLVKKVQLSVSSKTLTAGDKVTVKATVTPKKATTQKLKYSTSNKGVATVTQKGVITAKAAGTAKITAQATDGSKKKATITIQVKAKQTTPTEPEKPKDVKITALQADAADVTLNTGESKKLNITVKPDNATNKTLKFTSSDEGAVTVASDGTITAKAQGAAVVTAKATDGSNQQVQVNVTVTNKEKIRTIVTTDGEVDDMDSFMRLMLYSNEMDLAGLILSSSTYHYAGDPEKGIEPYRWTGTAWADEIMDDYQEVYSNLQVHADGYPTPAYLRSILKIGNIKNVGEMEEVTEGSEFMKDILLDDDNRTLYIQTWGGTNTTARALKSIEEQYKDTDQWEAIQKKIYDKAVIYIILNQDATYADYIAQVWPGIRVINDGGNFWRFAYMWKSVPEQLTSRLQGEWMYNNIKIGHGPLLENYKLMGDGTILEGELDNEQRGSEDYLVRNPQYNRYDFISEGDSPSFFYLLDTGLRSLEDPTYGGWGGRFGIEPDGTYKNTVSDFNPYTNADDRTYTLTRWFDDIQSDFAARADWCVASDYKEANHRPTVEVKEGLDLTAAPGSRVKLHASAADPDGDKLSYKWWQYYEADTYAGAEDGAIALTGGQSNTVSFEIPTDAQVNDTIHMVIEVKDHRDNYMTHYQRVIIKVTEPETITSVEISGTAASIQVGARTNLTATVLPETAANKNVVWASSDESIATVNTSGRVTGVNEGTVTITATSKADGTKAGTYEIAVTRTYASANTGKVRTIVTTDGEVDDMDSFMRLMLYSNEMDLAGLILSSSTYHYAGDPDKGIEPYRWTGTQWASEVLADYEAVYDNLRVHADGYPEPGYLRSILKIGNIKNVGEMEEVTEGSEFMKDILLDDDDRTLYIQTWGGTNTTARALKSIEEQYRDTDQWEAIQRKIYDKAVIYIILNQDATYADYIAQVWPGIKVINDGGNFWRFAYMWKSVPEQLTTRLQGNWMYNNIKVGHGSLLENYKLMGDGTILEGELDNEQRGSEDYLLRNPQYNRYDFISEGDSPSFFYLLDTGLRSLEDPTYGGWGGRFGVEPDGTYKNTVSDKNPYTNADDRTYTLTRWFDDIQSDFAARADWCVAPEYSAANHRPTVSVLEGVDLTAAPGQRLQLHASASDPDGDILSYKWWQYHEADTYNGSLDGNLAITGAETDTISFVVPEDAQDGDTVHMVIEVKDNRDNYMTHYQRVIITVEGRQEIQGLAIQLPEGTDAANITLGNRAPGWGGSPYAVQLAAVITPELTTNKTFTWTTSDETIATVNASGVLTPVAAGNVTITATANDGSGMAAQIALTVVKIED